MIAVVTAIAGLTMPASAGRQFTGAYPATNNHYGSVLYGVLVGFVLYLADQLAAGRPAAGALVPTSAAPRADFVVISVGRRVLFLKPGGRAR